MIPTGTIPEIALTLAIAIALAPLFGRSLANVYSGGPSFWEPIVGRIERGFFWMIGVDPRRPMHLGPVRPCVAPHGWPRHRLRVRAPPNPERAARECARGART